MPFPITFYAAIDSLGVFGGETAVTFLQNWPDLNYTKNCVIQSHDESLIWSMQSYKAEQIVQF